MGRGVAETSSRARGGAWATGSDAPVGLNATEGWTTTTTTTAAAARSRARASVEAVEIELERATVALERLEASQVALEEASRGGGGGGGGGGEGGGGGGGIRRTKTR